MAESISGLLKGGEMIDWTWLIPAVFVSFALGILAMALCVAAGRE